MCGGARCAQARASHRRAVTIACALAGTHSAPHAAPAAGAAVRELPVRAGQPEGALGQHGRAGLVRMRGVGPRAGHVGSTLHPHSTLDAQQGADGGRARWSLAAGTATCRGSRTRPWRPRPRPRLPQQPPAKARSEAVLCLALAYVEGGGPCASAHVPAPAPARTSSRTSAVAWRWSTRAQPAPTRRAAASCW